MKNAEGGGMISSSLVAISIFHSIPSCNCSHLVNFHQLSRMDVMDARWMKPNVKSRSSKGLRRGAKNLVQRKCTGGFHHARSFPCCVSTVHILHKLHKFIDKFG